MNTRSLLRAGLIIALTVIAVAMQAIELLLPTRPEAVTDVLACLAAIVFTLVAATLVLIRPSPAATL